MKKDQLTHWPHAVPLDKVGKVRDQEIGMGGQGFMLTNCVTPWSSNDRARWRDKLGFWKQNVFFFQTHFNTSTQTGVMCIERATLRGSVSVRCWIWGWGGRWHCESWTVSFGKTVSIIAIKAATSFLFFFDRSSLIYWEIRCDANETWISTQESVKYETPGKAGWQDLLLFKMQPLLKKKRLLFNIRC